MEFHPARPRESGGPPNHSSRRHLRSTASHLSITYGQAYRAARSAAIPQATMIALEPRLVSRIASGESRWRMRDTSKVRKSHHAAEPIATPATSASAVATSAPPLLMPTPANMPMNAMIVIGFVSVRPTVCAYDPAGVNTRPAAAASTDPAD